ncbi:hypothetical protein C1645_815724 [Glomus cerebriforme]|uniref:Uncharacterized protein n=1 Tax=Glomus cerebriforme TaxID=658196 RepID=A0A397TI65_9GLOM|nr:hypothetical protein C1645_815724 [Glomus cerebriforme]
MNIAVIGFEASEAPKQILSQIEDAVRGKQNLPVIKICFLDGKLDNFSIRRVIHSYYNAEIVNYNILFIKYDGWNKKQIQRKLCNSFENYNRNWFTESNVICVVGNNEWRPDVGIWYQWPTPAERNMPLVNNCISPDVWIEVFFNQDPDHQNALDKIDSVQQDLDGILDVEFVGIALSHTTNTFHMNPFPGAPTVLAFGQNARPFFAPYIIHWNRNYIPQYYIVDWNHYLVLRCGATLNFNTILDVISR